MTPDLQPDAARAERQALEAREAHRERRMRTALIAAGVAVMAAVATWLSSRQAGDTDAGVLWAGLLAILTLAALAAGWSAWRWRPGDDADRLAALRKARMGGWRDQQQNARAASVMFMPVALLSIMAIAVGAAARLTGLDAGDPPEVSDWVMAGAVVVWALLLPAMVMGWDGQGRQMKRVLEDELVRSLRSRAMIAGFCVLLVGSCVVYLLGLWRPALGVTLLPAVLWAGGATAALRFGWLHRQAERDDG